MPRTRPSAETLKQRLNVARIPEIIARLDDAYGLPEWRPHHDAISELVLTILSQNTSDANSGRAFVRLTEAFPAWDDVASAPLGALVAAIQPGGLAPTKAPRIQGALRDIKERTGGYDLQFLTGLPLEEARAWLRSIHGVGPKTAACVLMFALGRPAMPVDTHVFRVATRLALIPERAGRARMTPEKAHELLEAQVPPRDFYAFHIALIKHGRRVCTAQRPRCPECVLRDLCPAAAVFHPELAGADRGPARAAAMVGTSPRKTPSQAPRTGV
ncbi:MAG: endonuclease III [Chloroflexota bacterium]|nr:endonuclease III [Chloroflexota bacterium]